MSGTIDPAYRAGPAPVWHSFAPPNISRHLRTRVLHHGDKPPSSTDDEDYSTTRELVMAGFLDAGDVRTLDLREASTAWIVHIVREFLRTVGGGGVSGERPARGQISGPRDAGMTRIDWRRLGGHVISLSRFLEPLSVSRIGFREKVSLLHTWRLRRNGHSWQVSLFQSGR
jgi:hypothetical protein